MMSRSKSPLPVSLAACASAVTLFAGCYCPEVTSEPDSGLLVVKRNGGWCWFMDPRAIVDEGRILVGTAAGASDENGLAGDIDITAFDIDTHASETFTLHEEFQSDDHDSPSVIELPDGRYLAMYTKHVTDRLMRWRVSTNPHDPSAWEPEETLKHTVKGGVTYSNTVVLSAEPNVVYNFFRAEDQNPFVMRSSTEEVGFEFVGRLLRWDQTPRTGAEPFKVTGYTDVTRPYVRYASRGVDTIHFITTEDHPIAYDNSIYHGVIRGGAVYDSFGRLIDDSIADDDAASPVDLTRVFKGDANHVAWTVDLEVDANGHPYMAFSVQRDGAASRGKKGEGGYDLRYYYARFDGAVWFVHEMAYAGTRLYWGQDDYSGLVALHPDDPDTVYISTNADPETGDPLISWGDCRRHYEIFRGRTNNFGATWEWTPVTRDSRTDNLRPVVPKWESHTALLWLRGEYSSMNRYEQDVVGLIDPP